MTSESFYEVLPAFSSFNGVTETANYHDVPNDWTVVITDVRGSTAAIESGRYRDVNTVGAASIVAVTSALGNIKFPFVFGGDGATLLIPDSHVPAARAELLALQSLSQKQYGLELRIGFVPITLIYARGVKLKVGKYALSAGATVAVFVGGGLGFAENLVKSDPTFQLQSTDLKMAPNLKGLSCRWEPIPSKNGFMLSLLVKATGGDATQTYGQIVAEISGILGGQFESANPVNSDQMSYKSAATAIRDELKLSPAMLSISAIKRMIELIFCLIVFRFKIPVPDQVMDTRRYMTGLGTHSDYKKFDEMLRLTLDCNTDQIHKIRELLRKHKNLGTINFGLHQSKKALMTCFVNNTLDGNHIHFIDADEGGYAMAAKELKKVSD